MKLFHRFALAALGTLVTTGSFADATPTVRFGLLKNVTHAPALVALQEGILQKALGVGVKIEVSAFNNGSDFSTALASDQLDIGFVGPGPAINQYLKSKNFRVISGSNNGGAVLVVRSDAGIKTLADLNGKTVAIPTKGSTNDISLRLLLKQNGLKITDDSSGVQIVTRAPADTITGFRQKQIDATLIPEPWGTQIVEAKLGSVLVDWDHIPPEDGNYPLTILVASDAFLKAHKDWALAVIRANLEGIAFLKASPEKSWTSVSDQLKLLTGKGVEAPLVKAALDHLSLTDQVSLPSLRIFAQAALDAGYLRGVSPADLKLDGFLDLSYLAEAKKK
jgi:NitT/TauT family transport system substrate-binding protein